VVSSVAPPRAQAVDVTCGQTVADDTVGVLVADLSCPGSSIITLGRRATLQLNGHSLSATAPNGGQVGIACPEGPCRVEGPGQVSGFGGMAILALEANLLEVSDVQVSDNGVGIHGNRVILSDVQLSGNTDWGAGGERVVLTNVSAIGNPGDGITGEKIRGSDITTSGNGGNGVRCNNLKVDRLTAMNNGGYGVQSTHRGTTKLSESTLAGNAVADIGSQKRPRLLSGTTCDTSRRLSDGGADLGTWGVCAND
jgi:hypothetical protein